MRISTKSQSIKLFQAGEFGNYLQTFYSNREVIESGYVGGLMRRSLGAFGNNENIVVHSNRIHTIEFREGAHFWNELTNKLSNRCLLNGEVMRTDRGLYLFYNTVDMFMRPALRRPDAEHAYGLRASEILKHFLCTPGYEKLVELLDKYDGHVAEVSAFDCAVGALGWRTMIRDVRHDYPWMPF